MSDQPGNIRNLKPETIARIQELLDLSRPATQAPTPRPVFEEQVLVDIEEASEETLRYADEIIKYLADEGHGDYSGLRNEIALDIYDNGHFSGNWDAYFNPEDYDSDLPGFRVIQEDEYDQHMDDDEDRPDADDAITVPNGYLWVD